MQEDFLHYIWKHKAFDSSQLKTSSNDSVIISQLGQHNQNSGPDFFNAQLTIADQLWAGNVEIHIKSSDWFVHHHETDKAYDNVILHVVWEHDLEIYRKDNSIIPTLELKHYVNHDLFKNYQKLIRSKSWINCENDFAQTNNFLLNNWLERLYVERLERKSVLIEKMLKTSSNDWEAVLFKMLAKNFGLKVNGESFLSLANSFDFSLIRKIQINQTDLEALFFGQADLLNDVVQDNYYLSLQKQYKFLKQKFNLKNEGVFPVRFFRLRPPNFPTVRLSQLAMLYGCYSNLFSEVVSIENKTEAYKLFDIETSPFWEIHYTFAKTSKPVSKSLSKPFIDLLLINTIIPLQFSYARANAKTIDDKIFRLIKQIGIENNSVVSKFLNLKPMEDHALNSQALLQLKHEYCDKNKCLHCAIGNSLVGKN